MKNFSPNLVILVIVLVLVGASAVIFLNRQQGQGQISDSGKLANASDSPTLAASAENSSTDSSDVKYIESYNVEVNKSPLPSPASLSKYIYPGAQVITETKSRLELQSGDDSGKITQWYKEKINELGFNAKSFSQTNTNGVVLNKLTAAKPGDKIEVTIKKDQTQSNVSITVDRL